MPTKDALIASVRDAEIVDAHLTFGGKKLRLPGALAIVMHGDTAYIHCNLKEQDIYATKKGSDALTKTRGLIKQDVFEAFNPPPPEIQQARTKVNSVEVPRGYQWQIEGGGPRLVLIEGKARKPRGSRGPSKPNKEAYPLGFKIKNVNTREVRTLTGYTATGYRVQGPGGSEVMGRLTGRFWKEAK